MLRVARIAGGLLVVALLAACQPFQSHPISPSSSPVRHSASPEVLLGSAQALYVRYLREVEVISESGSKDYSALRPLLSNAAFAEEAASFDRQLAAGIHTKGPVKLAKFEKQTLDVANGLVTAYACIDLESVRVVNKSGDDVTPASRPNFQTFLPSFRSRDGKLVLEKNGTWSGDSIC